MSINTFIVASLGLICCVHCKIFEFHNTGAKEIWIGTQANAGKAPLNQGGWKMAPNEKVRRFFFLLFLV